MIHKVSATFDGWLLCERTVNIQGNLTFLRIAKRRLFFVSAVAALIRGTLSLLSHTETKNRNVVPFGSQVTRGNQCRWSAGEMTGSPQLYQWIDLQPLWNIMRRFHKLTEDPDSGQGQPLSHLLGNPGSFCKDIRSSDIVWQRKLETFRSWVASFHLRLPGLTNGFLEPSRHKTTVRGSYLAARTSSGVLKLTIAATWAAGATSWESKSDLSGGRLTSPEGFTVWSLSKGFMSSEANWIFWLTAFPAAPPSFCWAHTLKLIDTETRNLVRQFLHWQSVKCNFYGDCGRFSATTCICLFQVRFLFHFATFNSGSCSVQLVWCQANFNSKEIAETFLWEAINMLRGNILNLPGTPETPSERLRFVIFSVQNLVRIADQSPRFSLSDFLRQTS